MKGPLPFELWVFLACVSVAVLSIVGAYWGWFV